MDVHRSYYRGKKRSLWDRIWKDHSGHLVIWQNPNLWLIGWAVLTMISLLLSRGILSDIFSWAGSASLATWSLLEVFRGVNYFRRGLGMIVLVFCVASFIKLL